MFHFSRTVVGRTWSTRALIFSPLVQPPPLSRLFLTSGPVKPLAGGEMEGVWLLDAVCAFMRARERLCIRTPWSAFVSIRSSVCMCLSVTQYVPCLNPLSPKPYKTPHV